MITCQSETLNQSGEDAEENVTASLIATFRDRAQRKHSASTASALRIIPGPPAPLPTPHWFLRRRVEYRAPHQSFAFSMIAGSDASSDLAISFSSLGSTSLSLRPRALISATAASFAGQPRQHWIAVIQRQSCQRWIAVVQWPEVCQPYDHHRVAVPCAQSHTRPSSVREPGYH